MTSEDASPRRPASVITPEDLHAFFSEKGASLSCGVCRKADWEVFGEADEYPALMQVKGQAVLLGNHVPLLGLHCRNCAHVLLFSRLSILDWKNARAE